MPFKDVLEGRVDFYFAPYPLAIAPVKEGMVKLLATTSAKSMVASPRFRRWARKPGYAGSTSTPGSAYPRARNTQGHRDPLNRDINQTVADPEFRQQFVADGVEIAPMSPDQFKEFVRAEGWRYVELLSEDFCSPVFYGGCEGFSAGMQ